MEAKTIKISPSNYRRLHEVAGELQKETGKPISIDKTLSYVLNKGKLSDFAGSWKMSDKEAEEFMKDTRRMWRRWKISV